MQPGEPVQLELDPDEDGPVYEWFYEHRALAFAQHGVPGGGAGGVNGPSYKRWRLGLPVMATLYRLAGQLLSDMIDPNYFYLFDPSSLISAKSLNLCIPGGPNFEPLFRCALNSNDKPSHAACHFASRSACCASRLSAIAHSTCSG
jgi:pre-mRNA-processing factor 8